MPARVIRVSSLSIRDVEELRILFASVWFQVGGSHFLPRSSRSEPDRRLPCRRYDLSSVWARCGRQVSRRLGDRCSEWKRTKLFDGSRSPFDVDEFRRRVFSMGLVLSMPRLFTGSSTSAQNGGCFKMRNPRTIRLVSVPPKIHC